MRANNGVVLAHAIRAGNGVGVLPCFLGDGDPAMVRVTPVIREAATEQWLLVHGDLRNVPRVRIVMDALVALFRACRAEVEGEAGMPSLAASAQEPCRLPSNHIQSHCLEERKSVV